MRTPTKNVPRLAVLLVAIALVLPVGAWAASRIGGDAPSVAATGAPVDDSSRRASSSPGVGDRVQVEGESEEASRPVRVRVPRADIDVATELLRTDTDGRLESPRTWQRAGWLASGAAPGDVGPAVVAGHVDSPTGPAAFTGLDVLRAGDEVVVDRADGSSVTFVVDRTEVVVKGAFPTAEVYGPTPDAQLRLITCDGPYLRSSGGYQDNLVVYATAEHR